jgi:hypothetical protein
VREGEIERDIAAHAEAAHRGGRGAQGLEQAAGVFHSSTDSACE